MQSGIIRTFVHGGSGFLCPKLQKCNFGPRLSCKNADVSISAPRESFFRIIGWKQRKAKHSTHEKGGARRTTEYWNTDLKASVPAYADRCDRVFFFSCFRIEKRRKRNDRLQKRQKPRHSPRGGRTLWADSKPSWDGLVPLPRRSQPEHEVGQTPFSGFVEIITDLARSFTTRCLWEPWSGNIKVYELPLFETNAPESENSILASK